MPTEPEKDRYLEPYRRSLAANGTGFDVTLWASPRSQRLRFQVFTEMCFLGGRTVLDAGCSRGDMAAFLIEHDVPFKRYIGIDALDDVIAFAKSRRLSRCDFVAGDFVAEPALLLTGAPDVVCISGSLNTMDDVTAMSVLNSAWGAAGQVLMFNFLSDRCGPTAPLQDDFARRLDTMRLLDWALSHTPIVQFRQDYFPAGHDATIMMRKK